MKRFGLLTAPFLVSAVILAPAAVAEPTCGNGRVECRPSPSFAPEHKAAPAPVGVAGDDGGGWDEKDYDHDGIPNGEDADAHKGGGAWRSSRDTDAD